MDPSRINRPGGLRGEKALLAAVIAQAVKDARQARGEERDDAQAYFAGDTYREHLAMLGLPEDLLPAELDEQV